jgi:hypothetical protein
MNRELVVEIGGKKYTVKYPNVGQLIDISTREMLLSGGKMGDLLYQGTKDHMNAYAGIKTMAFIEIMLPNLVKDLKTESLLKLDPVDFTEINEVYWKQINKWFEECKKGFSNPLAEVPEEEILS